MSRWLWLGVGGVAVFGAVAEALAPVPGEPLLTVGDFLTGGAILAAAVVAARSNATGSACLLLAAPAASFGGTVAGDLRPAGDWLLYVHRPLLVLAILAAPGWRPRSAVASGVCVGAAVAAVPGLAEAGWAAAILAGALLLGCRPRAACAWAAAAFGLAAIAAVADLEAGAFRAVILGYDVAIAGAALALVRDLQQRTRIADRVLELGEAGPLSAALSVALGDEALEVLPAGAHVDDGRAVTPVEDGGRVIALLAHAPHTLSDPQTRSAASTATRLALANAELTSELEGALADLRASSRRLVVTAETARGNLQRRLHDGPIARLRRLGDEADDAALRVRLQSAARALEAFATGLHPRVLDDRGLVGAVRALAAQAHVPVHVEAADGSWPPAVEAAAYFLCAEALTNVAKYARASRVSITISEHDGALTVEIADDGVGGADPAAGSGLRGLQDRIVALGGGLKVSSDRGRGTRLIGRIPL